MLRLRPSRSWIVLALAVGVVPGCMTAPPKERVALPFGDVRADDAHLAADLAARLTALKPRVEALLPDARVRDFDVWIQEHPALYAFPFFGASAQSEADGFWAERPGRIHLRRDAQDLERTLAHEIVHAALGESWRVLPGTLEEGLCDLVAVMLCEDGAKSLRAGRLAAACFALGGMELDLEVELAMEGPATGSCRRLSYLARVLLQNELAEDLDPQRVFDVRAGLSSTRMEPGEKRAFYGLGFAVISRIVARHGLEGLHGLCEEALAAGQSRIPTERLLAAADLPADREGWRRALLDDLGRDEMAELVRLYPQIVNDALAACWGALGRLDADSRGDARVTLRLVGSSAEVLLRPVAPR